MTKAPATAPVFLLYDVWGDDGTRHKAGETIQLPVATAKALIADGKAERADPMPGEG